MRLTVARFVLAAVAVLAASLGAASLRAMAEGPLYPQPAVDHGSHFHRGRFIRRAGARSGRCHVTRIRQAGSGGQWAGGHVGAESVAHTAPDGYTILFGTNGTLGIGPALYKNLRYDPERDLAPIGILRQLPLLLISGYEGLKRFEMTEMASWLLREHCRRDHGSTGATATNVQPRAFAVLITRSKLIVRQR